MWIQAIDGTAYNSNTIGTLRLIEFEGKWRIEGTPSSGDGSLSEVIVIAEFTDEKRGKDAFARLLKKLPCVTSADLQAARLGIA